jgi:hypothetical protein
MGDRAWRWGAPRLITREQLRAYLQMQEAELADRLRRGQLPGPLWDGDAALTNARWDRHAVDRALDRASSLRSDIDAAVAELDREFGFLPGGTRAARSPPRVEQPPPGAPGRRRRTDPT